ncbi:ERMES complex Ca(2+)-binding regulatory GTPase gem1 [Malassezia nana]|uniref:Mitochondrial Rho GTPase n=1 Tax=Malassezia nana TaxID=180528 RepID=A0AAF0EHR6_9BASI|nr:ERMES complex Ca(2+)-binding regulatory GTPase gem1 [Malassezia nana]
MRQEIRLVLVGDTGVGKSSLVMYLIKEHFLEDVQSIVPEITLPSDASPAGVTTKIIDTGSGAAHHERVETEMRRAHAIILVYSVIDQDSFERVSSYWLPSMRSLGINVPVVLVGSKIDLRPSDADDDALEEEIAPLMVEFKELETCIECSAKLSLNVGEVFFYAQKAVLYPTAPLYDSRTHTLKPACVDALRNIFHLCDTDKDGVLSDEELNNFQFVCFDAPLHLQELEGIKELVSQGQDNCHTVHIRDQGLTLAGFLYLHTLFVQRGRLETTWSILWTFGYGMDLSLSHLYVYPPFEVPQGMAVELSPAGYQFFTEVFKAHDKDHDGALNPHELQQLFITAPGGQHPWNGTGFPNSTVTDEAGAVTLQGWLAQWSMTTLLEPRTTLAYLAYLGYLLFSNAIKSNSPTRSSSGTSTPQISSASPSSYSWFDGTAVGTRPVHEVPPSVTTSALKLVRPRRPGDRKRSTTEQCSVFLALVLGAPGSGKSALLRNLAGKPFQPKYTPTHRLQRAVGAVEHDGAEHYLVMQEYGSHNEAEALRNPANLAHVSAIVFVYDSSDTHSFSYISNLRQQYPYLAHFPSLFVATKSDLDLARQRHEVQPDMYCRKLGLNVPHLGAGPLNVSSRLGEVAELYSLILMIAMDPRGAVPAPSRSLQTMRLRWRTGLWGLLAAGGSTLLVVTIWRFIARGTSGVGLGPWAARAPSWMSWIKGASSSALRTDL